MGSTMVSLMGLQSGPSAEVSEILICATDITATTERDLGCKRKTKDLDTNRHQPHQACGIDRQPNGPHRRLLGEFPYGPRLWCKHCKMLHRGARPRSSVPSSRWKRHLQHSQRGHFAPRQRGGGEQVGIAWRPFTHYLSG